MYHLYEVPQNGFIKFIKNNIPSNYKKGSSIVKNMGEDSFSFNNLGFIDTRQCFVNFLDYEGLVHACYTFDDASCTYHDDKGIKEDFSAQWISYMYNTISDPKKYAKLVKEEVSHKLSIEQNRHESVMSHLNKCLNALESTAENKQEGM